MEPTLADTGIELRALLQRAGISPEQLARRLNQQAAGLGLPNRIDQKTPYKWFRGTQPRPPWPALVAQLLSSQLGIEVNASDLGWKSDDSGILCVSANSGLILPWTAHGALTAAAEVTEATTMDRRVFLGLTGTALTAPALDWLLAQPVRDLHGFKGRRIHEPHVKSIEELTAHLRRMDDQFGGGAILNLVRAQVRYVVDLLRDHSYTESVGGRLHGAAAELLRLGGWLSFDSGHQAQAQRYWLAALHSAHAAGDRAVGANILGFMSCQAKDLELYDDAIKLSEAARRGYSGTSPRVKAILNLRAAQAYAQIGEVTTCRTAIDSAYESLRDTAPDTGDPSWSYWLDEAQANEQIGYCYLRLEDWDRARGHLRTALRLQDNPDTREGALRQALLAITYARQGEPEYACQAGIKASDILAKDVDSDRCVGHIRHVQIALGPYRKVPVVTEFNERLDQMFGVPA
jgi:tetratricopeptide (TPR) repeat protein